MSDKKNINKSGMPQENPAPPEQNSGTPPDNDKKTQDIDVNITEPELDANGVTEEEKKAADELAKKIEEALSAANDKYIRLYAEYDNFRKRSSKEKTDAYNNAYVDCVTEIIPVIDNFERALNSDCSDENYKNGILMIFNQFMSILDKLGIKEIDAAGKPFDPNFHHAVQRVDKENTEENIVCDVLQKGYTLGDKVIRYAMVTVSN